MVHPYRRLALVTAAGTIAGLAEAGVLVLVVRVALAVTVDDPSAITVPLVSVEPSTGQLLWTAVVLSLVAMALHVGLARLTARISADVLINVRSRAIDAYGRASWERQAQEREGALQETVSSLAGNSGQLANTYANGLASLLSLVTLLATAALVDPLAMAVVVLFGAALSLSFRPLTRLTRRRARAYVRSNSKFAEDVSQMSSLSMELRVFGVQEQASAELRDSVRRTAALSYRMRVTQRLGWSLYRDIAVLFVVLAIGALYLMSEDALLGAGTVVILVVRALNSAQALQRNLQTVNELSPNLDMLLERLEALEAAAELRGERPLPALHSLELHDVTYEYVSGDGALRGITLRIEPGEVLGIVGPSGGGKSTLVQVLLRLRHPREGVVMVNGLPAEEFQEADWARLVALVPQEPKLMEASIADNIRFLREGITDDQVRAAARDAHVEAELLAQPAGFDTQLGPRGTGLSGGQKQRLAIARALVGQPQLIVLDEPTSALDHESERRLQETIRGLKGRVTLVIVAHRTTTLASCDRLVVIRNGSIDGLGTPAELAAQPGFYQSIAASLVDAPAGATSLPSPSPA